MAAADAHVRLADAEAAPVKDKQPADEAAKPLEGPILSGAPPGYTRVLLYDLTPEQIEYLRAQGAIVTRAPEGDD